MRIDLPSRILFFAAMAATIYLTLNPAPPHLVFDRYGDKFEHMLAFATMGVFARLGFPRAKNLTILERLSFVGALIEVFQAIPWMHRDCDWHDWAADTAGVALGLLALWFLRKLLPQPEDRRTHDRRE